jgi:hypothetical protein
MKYLFILFVYLFLIIVNSIPIPNISPFDRCINGIQTVPDSYLTMNGIDRKTAMDNNRKNAEIYCRLNDNILNIIGLPDI